MTTTRYLQFPPRHPSWNLGPWLGFRKCDWRDIRSKCSDQWQRPVALRVFLWQKFIFNWNRSRVDWHGYPDCSSYRNQYCDTCSLSQVNQCRSYRRRGRWWTGSGVALNPCCVLLRQKEQKSAGRAESLAFDLGSKYCRDESTGYVYSTITRTKPEWEESGEFK